MAVRHALAFLLAACFAASPAQAAMAVPDLEGKGKNVLKPPPTDKQAAPTSPAKTPAKAKAPPPPAAAPRKPVEVKNIPEFIPPGPPPLDESQLRPAVAALLKASAAPGANADLARWVDGGPCWVWAAPERQRQPWAKYRFLYEGGCKLGRAEGQGRLKVDGQDAAGNWNGLYQIDAAFLAGIPLAETRQSGGARFAIGLSDRSILAWLGSSLNEEADVFSVARADDQGRLRACETGALLAVATSAEGKDDVETKQMLRRAVATAEAECPERAGFIWQVSLASPDGLSLGFSEDGQAARVLPLLAQGEAQNGIFYAYVGGAAARNLPLARSARPIVEAQPLVWSEPADDSGMTLGLVLGVPALLLALLFAAGRILRGRD